MANDPAFLLYSKDWLEGTAEMSAAEKGIYIDLLCYQHQRGFIPEDTKRIAAMVGMKEDDFINVWEYIKNKFALLEPGKLVNKKLNKVTGERNEHSKMRTILGTFGGQLRALKTSEKNKERIRKSFNYKEFLDIEYSLLPVSLANWLAKSQTKAKQIIEDEDGIEDGIEDNNKKGIPELTEFLEYAKTIKAINYSELEFSLKAKYRTWVEDGWKDGHGNEIKNWKTKLLNTIPHMKPMKNSSGERERVITSFTK